MRAPKPTSVGLGNDVLGQIFGSRDVSRTVSQNAAVRTGLDPARPGSSGLVSLLDFDGDGNPLDDILSMAGKLLR